MARKKKSSGATPQKPKGKKAAAPAPPMPMKGMPMKPGKGSAGY